MIVLMKSMSWDNLDRNIAILVRGAVEAWEGLFSH